MIQSVTFELKPWRDDLTPPATADSAEQNGQEHAEKADRRYWPGVAKVVAAKK